MRELFERHRAALVIFAALALPLFLLYVHGRSPRRTTIVEAALIRVTAPAQSAASRIISSVGGFWSGYVDVIDAKEQALACEDKSRILAGEALQTRTYELENERLRQLLAFKRERRDLETIAAHVIGKDVSSFARVVRIELDVGSRDGLREGMPVVMREGLVGRINQVSGGYAEVMLAVDARSSVNVKVAGKGVTGTLEGTGTGNTYTARLLYLHKAEGLAVGDEIVTSGHDKVFPPGITVGYIHSLEERQRGLYYELQVVPAVNFSTIEEVLVVVGQRTDPADASLDAEGATGTPRAGGRREGGR